MLNNSEHTVMTKKEVLNEQYEIYSDESGSGVDRFESIGTLSCKKSVVAELKTELVQVLAGHQLSHCEYKKVAGGCRYNCALEFLTILHRYITQGDVKVMVLVWDKHDKRHQVPGRDDIANMSIMYYWALKTTKRQWMDTSLDSNFFPDELSKVDFKSIIKYLECTRVRSRDSMLSLFGVEFTKSFPSVNSHNELNSSKEPLIQLIDILTGIVRLTYEEKTTFDAWRHGHEKTEAMQDSLFVVEEDAVTISKNKSYKYRLVHELDALLKRDTMQVALKSEDGFLSKKPSNGYFLWKYEPQRDDDKAPTKNDSRRV